MRTAAKATEGAEKFATSLVGGYANFTRSLLDISLANVQHTLATVEKLAGARSLNEAVEVQADFVRESARANVERIRNAANPPSPSSPTARRPFRPRSPRSTVSASRPPELPSEPVTTKGPRKRAFFVRADCFARLGGKAST